MQEPETADIAAKKAHLRTAISAANADGTYSDAAFDALHAAIKDLVPHSPIARPLDEQEKVQSPWRTLFAQFGPRHTAGKPIVHETTLALQSFNAFPKIPVIVKSLEQEIHVDGNHYNNVAEISTPDGNVTTHLIIWGRYSIPQDHPQRYAVAFYEVELRTPDGMSEDELCAAFNLPQNHPLKVSLKPPKLHSDVVYCDADMRINFGSMGGVYVLDRLNHAGHSVRFGT